MLGISSIALPSLATLTPSERLRVWSDEFDRGSRQIPTTMVASSALLLGAAYYAQDGFGPVGANRRLILVSAAASALTVIPYTLVVMIPNIKWLKKALFALDAGQETDAAVRKWDLQHRLRIFAGAAAYALAMLELVSC
ncbi:hypothetical protein EXIGLDRAFT_723172 [Exidia glandulosa HHB12029]|uniref:DUF1772-domain-containing protein n=1 Tax=Exidia glandulosa HHB12029 TaxID=1314781 RepID=A0A165N078_EXIGL|nr:hypothetical protein EXIGLDRAFT_723172 [Exidia glandulosa HHB12029]